MWLNFSSAILPQTNESNTQITINIYNTYQESLKKWHILASVVHSKLEILSRNIENYFYNKYIHI